MSALAAVLDEDALDGAGGINLPKDPDDSELFSTILTTFLVLGFAVALLMIMLNTFRMVISRGNPEAFGKARSGLIASLAGLGLMLLTGTILRIVFEVV